MKTAKQAWTNEENLPKMNWWFISELSNVNGAAIIWGKIKSPLLEGQEEGDHEGYELVDTFTQEGDYFKSELTFEYLLPITEGDECIVHFGKQSDEYITSYPKEFIRTLDEEENKALEEQNKLKWSKLEQNLTTYLKLGDLIDGDDSRDERDYYPFTFLYTEEIQENRAVGKLIVYSKTNETR